MIKWTVATSLVDLRLRIGTSVGGIRYCRPDHMGTRYVSVIVAMMEIARASTL
jgi:hypothetical protein